MINTILEDFVVHYFYQWLSAHYLVVQIPVKCAGRVGALGPRKTDDISQIITFKQADSFVG
jgi:hypothetical protein